jgi:hypothetical protein
MRTIKTLLSGAETEAQRAGRRLTVSSPGVTGADSESSGAPLSAMPAPQREALLDDINYLNLAEIRALCKRFGIPYRIQVETPDGGMRTTKDTDRKPIVLERVRRYLTTGTPGPPTRLPMRIVREDAPPAALSAGDRLYYRWYNKAYVQVIGLLRELTGGRFRNGALARVLIMERWRRGEAPTFAEFAAEWTAARDAGRDLVAPEYAFLTDRRHGRAHGDWKRLREEKARSVLAAIESL